MCAITSADKYWTAGTGNTNSTALSSLPSCSSFPSLSSPHKSTIWSGSIRGRAVFGLAVASVGQVGASVWSSTRATVSISQCESFWNMRGRPISLLSLCVCKLSRRSPVIFESAAGFARSTRMRKAKKCSELCTQKYTVSRFTIAVAACTEYTPLPSRISLVSRLPRMRASGYFASSSGVMAFNTLDPANSPYSSKSKMFLQVASPMSRGAALNPDTIRASGSDKATLLERYCTSR